MMTDPIADMLTRIRNAAQARHDSVDVPFSRMKERIAHLLVEEGYLKEARKVKARKGGKDLLRIQLKYDREKNSVISGLRRVSRPGLRVYVGYREIPLIRRGLGISLLSTPKGVVVDREARRAKVGGELLCSVW
ncbi:MAG TPA: 30S ribosomal protein S8 [Candidatus Acidoferrales bacterium]|nr:30S ribosomal protein S8 [Candidatus Acidoferrales bacterium]